MDVVVVTFAASSHEEKVETQPLRLNRASNMGVHGLCNAKRTSHVP